MAEIQACINFIEYFRKEFVPDYDVEYMSLRSRLSNLKMNRHHTLVLFLHQIHDQFSFNFCHFLKNPKIMDAFKMDDLHLYCSNISKSYLNKGLIHSLSELGVLHSNLATVGKFILEGRSGAFMICYQEGPVILETFSDPQDLIYLTKLLTRRYEQEEKPAEDKPLTALDYLKYMEKCMDNDEFTSYEREDYEELKATIKYAMYGPPNETEEVIQAKPQDEQRKIEKRLSDQQKEVDNIFSKILDINNRYCKWNGRVVLKVIYICTVPLPEEKKERSKKIENYNPDSDFLSYPVFILRKCKHKSSPENACRTVIDIEGRVYKSWADYLTNNRLPPSIMLYPKNGRYLYDEPTTYYQRSSPACDLSTKIAKGGDVTAGVAGVLAGGVGIAGSSATVVGAVPVFAAAAPVVLPAAAVVGIGSGIYVAGRSLYSLFDRKKHEQSIHVKDAESRGAYLNIVGGALSIGMIGVTRTVSLLASRGVELGQGTRYILYGINGVNIAVGGVGIGNAIYHAATSENNSKLVYAQLGISILFFTHSVCTFKNITTIIEESQNTALNEIELSLRSNRHRRTFNKLLKESIRTQGEVKGKASVISTIRKTGNVDDVMAVLTRSNKMLNREGIRFSAAGDKILLNGKPVDMMNFGSMPKSDQIAFVQKFPPIPENLKPAVRAEIHVDVTTFIKGLEIFARFYQHRDIHKLVDGIIDEILCRFDMYTCNIILDITKRFLKDVDPNIIHLIAKLTHNVLKLTINWIVTQLSNMDSFQKFFNNKHENNNIPADEQDRIVKTLVDDFCSLYANSEYDRTMKAIRKENRRKNNPIKTQVKCNECGGYYYQESKSF